MAIQPCHLREHPHRSLWLSALDQPVRQRRRSRRLVEVGVAEVLLVGVPVGETIFIALTDEKSFAVKTDVDPIDVGFLITLICANLVSVGKSFVESSNLAYTKILSVPNSSYRSNP